MHKFVLCIVVLGCVAIAYGQESGPGARLGAKTEPAAPRQADKPATTASTATLDRARRIFQAADRNNDSRIELAELEAGRLRVPADEFRQRDLDANGAWNRDEFTLWYRGLLIKSGQKPGGDLEAEATRLLAQQRAKVAPVAAAEPQDPAVVELEARLQRALDHLEKQALARQATRDDFGAVRQAWEARLAAAQPAGDEGAQATLRQKVGRALEDLERRARDGQATREEYAQLRQALLTRARAAGAPAAPVAEGETSLEARFAQALDELELKALARQATREQFGAVREMLAARARRTAKAEGLEDGAATQLQQDYERALARLEERALAGQVTRAEFTELRATLVTRARRAANAPAVGSVPSAAQPIAGQGRVAGEAPAPVPAPAGSSPRAPDIAPTDIAPTDAAPTDAAPTDAAPAARGAGQGRRAKSAEKVEPAPAPEATPDGATGGGAPRPAPAGRPTPQPTPAGARGG